MLIVRLLKSALTSARCLRGGPSVAYLAVSPSDDCAHRFKTIKRLINMSSFFRVCELPLMCYTDEGGKETYSRHVTDMEKLRETMVFFYLAVLS